jgi:hypothetical protein
MSKAENGGASSVAASAVIGAEVSLKLQSGEVKGKVYAHDGLSGCCVLSSELGNGKHAVRFVPTRVQNVAINVISKEGQEPLESLPAVNVHALEEREKKALADAEAAIACIGKDVSGEAQEIFDALRKTYPCRWQGPLIIVLEQATVTPPYRKESCSGEESVVERIQMVLNQYWQKKENEKND